MFKEAGTRCPNIPVSSTWAVALQSVTPPQLAIWSRVGELFEFFQKIQKHWIIWIFWILLNYLNYLNFIEFFTDWVEINIKLHINNLNFIPCQEWNIIICHIALIISQWNMRIVVSCLNHLNFLSVRNFPWQGRSLIYAPRRLLG